LQFRFTSWHHHNGLCGEPDTISSWQLLLIALFAGLGPWALFHLWIKYRVRRFMSSFYNTQAPEGMMMALRDLKDFDPTQNANQALAALKVRVRRAQKSADVAKRASIKLAKLSTRSGSACDSHKCDSFASTASQGVVPVPKYGEVVSGLPEPARPPQTKATFLSMKSSRTSMGDQGRTPVTLEDIVDDNWSMLLGVDVQHVVDDLVEATTKEQINTVMKNLYDENVYLRKYDPTDSTKRTAIMSYRCESRPWDEFTLDPGALLGGFQAAHENNIDFIWLDCWAYRRKPPWQKAYIHGEFTTTLELVMKTVCLVIWLPRSRIDAFGSYQYRLWCSFEASLVQFRKLPVVVAGYEPDAFQCLIAVCGSYLAVGPNYGDGTDVTQLGRLNNMFYLFLAFSVSTLITIICLTDKPPADPTTYLALLIAGRLAYIIAVSFLWFWLRTRVGVRDKSGQAVMLARNGKGILQLMVAAGSHKTELPELNLPELQRQLPWLPAYDRRDVMPIKEIFDELAITTAGEWAKGKKRSSIFNELGFNSAGASGRAVASRQAVALSVFAQAMLIHSPGDAPKGRPLRKWLAETGTILDQEVGDEEHAAVRMAERFRVKNPAERTRVGKPLPAMTWLDEDPFNALPTLPVMRRVAEEMVTRAKKHSKRHAERLSLSIQSTLSHVDIFSTLSSEIAPQADPSSEEEPKHKEPSIQVDGVQTVPRGAIGNLGGGDTVISEEVALSVEDLSAMHWNFVRGSGGCVLTPAGPVWIRRAIGNKWYFVGIAPMFRALPWNIGIMGFLILDRIADLLLTTLYAAQPYYYWVARGKVGSHLHGFTPQGPGPYNGGPDWTFPPVPHYEDWVGWAYIENVLNIPLLISVLLLMWCFLQSQYKTIWEHRRMPVPCLRSHGKLEYMAFLWLLAAAWLYLAVTSNIQDINRDWRWIQTLAYIINATMLFLDGAFALWHAVASSCKEGNPKFLFEITSHRWEVTHSLVA